MPDREKVIKGLECCSVPEGHCEKCPYETYGDVSECTSVLARDALALLKEDCHNCKLECLLQKYDQLKEKYDKLLKEQEHKDRMFHALEDDWKRLKELLKEKEEQKHKWFRDIAEIQYAHTNTDGMDDDEASFHQGVCVGLQMAYDMIFGRSVKCGA